MNGVFNPINERLVKVTIKVGHLGITMLAVYAPTEVDEAETCDQFYEILQENIDQVNKKHMILGDFNARVGQPSFQSSLHGKHNSDVDNNNGRRLVDFCNYNNFMITNTIFPHKKIHQFTWHHPSQQHAGHVIDYILVNSEFRSYFLDTKVFRRTMHTSDHLPLISKLRFPSTIQYKRNDRMKKSFNPKKYDTDSPNNDIIKNFKNTLCNYPSKHVNMNN